MCGICGVFSTSFASPEVKAFKELFMFSQFRGEDSSGVFTVTRQNYNSNWRAGISKSLAPSSVFMAFDDTIQEFLNKGSSNLKAGIVGHCRAATKGNITEENAHPFMFENVVGVHNGTILRKFKGSDSFETDSEALYKLINDTDIETALNEIESPSSAYVLVYYDKRTGKINCVRNEKRPLWFTYFFGTSSLMFASEKWMLDVVCKRHNWTPSPGPVFGDNPDKVKYFTLSENSLFSFDPNDPKKYSLTELKVKKSNVYSGYTSGRHTQYNSGYQTRHDQFWKEHTNRMHPEDFDPPTKRLTKAEKKALKRQERQQKSSKSISNQQTTETSTENERIVRGNNGSRISFSDFEQACLEGCCMCGDILDADETNLDEKVGWYNDDQIICEVCMEQDWIKQYITNPVKH